MANVKAKKSHKEVKNGAKKSVSLKARYSCNAFLITYKVSAMCKNEIIGESIVVFLM